ncbi:MAG: hypothetical protein KDC38_10485 [Planctomycetes bacterium]|nr:hypothetical protein [Planctomycetota bacterium]
MSRSSDSPPLTAASVRFVVGLGLAVLVASHVDAQTPRATPGVIPPGQGCASETCPGFGTRTDGVTREFSPIVNRCGGGGGVSITYGGLTLQTQATAGGQCPASVTEKPSCPESKAKSGCCILSSTNLPELRYRLRCQCTQRSWWTLGIGCSEHGCLEDGPPIFAGYSLNCMKATACGEDAPAGGCNEPPVQQAQTGP